MPPFPPDLGEGLSLSLLMSCEFILTISTLISHKFFNWLLILLLPLQWCSKAVDFIFHASDSFLELPSSRSSYTIPFFFFNFPFLCISFVLSLKSCKQDSWPYLSSLVKPKFSSSFSSLCWFLLMSLSLPWIVILISSPVFVTFFWVAMEACLWYCHLWYVLLSSFSSVLGYQFFLSSPFYSLPFLSLLFPPLPLPLALLQLYIPSLQLLHSAVFCSILIWDSHNVDVFTSDIVFRTLSRKAS